MRETLAVHPHARGDGRDPAGFILPGLGSLPRPWGRLKLPLPDQVKARFTPTPVGTAPTSGRGAAACPVHPHARGDGWAAFWRTAGTSGSPPRPWGRLGYLIAHEGSFRFTPTPVGTASRGSTQNEGLSVHPHARGDGASGMNGVVAIFGSPPRPWGRPVRRRQCLRRARFTPTPVGTARRTGWPPSTIAVHPHARGDGPAELAPAADDPGSPPRPWGRRSSGRTNVSRSRFTPTPVGTASCRSGTSDCATVHPHARGDGRASLTTQYRRAGSPPRPWGRPLVGRLDARWARFTPTPVGTACPSCPRTSRISVHPHARGDGRPGS